MKRLLVALVIPILLIGCTSSLPATLEPTPLVMYGLVELSQEKDIITVENTASEEAWVYVTAYGLDEQEQVEFVFNSMPPGQTFSFLLPKDTSNVIAWAYSQPIERFSLH